MKSKKEAFIIALVFILLLVAIKYDFNPTGFFAYQPAINHTWDFSNISSYIFNSSEINFTNNEVKLSRIPLFYQWQETSNKIASITSAIRDDIHDDTSKVIFLDENITNIDENKKLSIKFNNSLNNNDMISLYLNSMSKEPVIYLCPVNVACNTSNYGSAIATSTGNFSISLIISNLPLAADQFDINVNDTAKIDYITAVYSSTTAYNATNYSYVNASIETNDLNFEGQPKLGLFNEDSNLNNQHISYKYSIDSGLTWFDVSSNNLSNVNVSNSKIRILALLFTNSTVTPVLNSLSLTYYASCSENWTCSEWSLCASNIKTRSCIENNNCISPENKPQEVLVCGDFIRIYNVDSIELILVTSQNISNIPINLLEENSPNNSNLLKLKDLNLKLNKTINDSLINTTLKFFYNATEVDSLNINLSTMSFYYYNNASSLWEQIPTMVNLSGSYIIANLTHFSTYGVFASSNEAGSSGGGSGSGGGGSGGSSGSPGGSGTNSINQITAENEIEKKELQLAEEAKKSLSEEKTIEAEKTKEQISSAPLTGKTTFVGNIKTNLKNILAVSLIILLIVAYITYKIRHQKTFKDRKITKSK